MHLEYIILLVYFYFFYMGSFRCATCRIWYNTQRIDDQTPEVQPRVLFENAKNKHQKLEGVVPCDGGESSHGPRNHPIRTVDVEIGTCDTIAMGGHVCDVMDKRNR
jgi:hypothetical protein